MSDKILTRCVRSVHFGRVKGNATVDCVDVFLVEEIFEQTALQPILELTTTTKFKGNLLFFFTHNGIILSNTYVYGSDVKICPTLSKQSFSLSHYFKTKDQSSILAYEELWEKHYTSHF